MRSLVRNIIKHLKSLAFGIVIISFLLTSILSGLLLPEYLDFEGQQKLIARFVGIGIVGVGVLTTLVIYELRDSR